jgi:uncharacterized protein (TIGR02466 family)
MITSCFHTNLYRARLGGTGAAKLNADLAASIYLLSEEDEAGKAWCDDNAYLGYTSYGSINDLAWRMPAFGDLQSRLMAHALAFAEACDFDLSRGRLAMDSLWVNILPQGAGHSGHIHPHSVISGTYYVSAPDGASALRFEDPRLPMMMAAPPRKTRARAENRTFVSIKPSAGVVLLWESWLRHEVPPNLSEDDRLSVSFNLRWENN